MTQLDPETLAIIRTAKSLLDRIRIDPEAPFADSNTTEDSENTEASETTEDTENSESSENKEGKDGTEASEGSEDSESSEDSERSEETEHSEDSENSESTEDSESERDRIFAPLIDLPRDVFTNPEHDEYLRTLREMHDVLKQRYSRPGRT